MQPLEVLQLVLAYLGCQSLIGVIWQTTEEIADFWNSLFGRGTDTSLAETRLLLRRSQKSPRPQRRLEKQTTPGGGDAWLLTGVNITS